MREPLGVRDRATLAVLYSTGTRRVEVLGLRSTPLRYDEPANVAHMRLLPIKLRVVFALLCAARLLPSYARFHARTGRGDPEVLDSLAESLWEDATGREMPSQEVQQAVARATQLVPNEDDGWDEETSIPFATKVGGVNGYMLTSFHAVVESAAAQGVKYGEVMQVGRWELIFSQKAGDGLAVIKHALYR